MKVSNSKSYNLHFYQSSIFKQPYKQGCNPHYLIRTINTIHKGWCLMYRCSNNHNIAYTIQTDYIHFTKGRWSYLWDSRADLRVKVYTYEHVNKEVNTRPKIQFGLTLVQLTQLLFKWGFWLWLTIWRRKEKEWVKYTQWVNKLL